jgi:hypothetical protein
MLSFRPRNQAIRPLLGVAAIVFFGCMFGSSAHEVLGAPSPDKQPNVKSVAPISFPDGVIDPDGRTAFVSSPRGGIQAVQLEDGKVLWTNDSVAAKSWLVAGTRLIARGERLSVLDLRSEGKLLRHCEAPGFPKVEVPDRCMVSFNLWDPHVAGDNLEAKWYAVAAIDRSKGRPFAFQAWTAFNKAAPVGTLKIDLGTGRAEVQTDAKPADISSGQIPEAAKPEQRTPASLPESLLATWRQYQKDQNGRITVLDGRLVGVSLTLEMAGQEYRKNVVLNAWDLKTAAPAKPVALVKGKALDIANVVLTEDGRHAGVVFSTSAVTIYSLADGQPVARDVTGVSSPETAFVISQRLYYAEPGGTGGERKLRAIDLRSGKSVWERPLQPRKTVPLPP